MRNQYNTSLTTVERTIYNFLSLSFIFKYNCLDSKSWFTDNFLDQTKTVITYNLVSLQVICTLPKEVKRFPIKIQKDIQLKELKRRILQHMVNH